MFPTHLLLAVVWAALAGELSTRQLAIGWLFGLVALWLPATGGQPESAAYLRRLRRLAGFIGFFCYEVVVTSLQLAHDLVTPTSRLRPGIVAVPLAVETEVEATLLSCLLTLTPGTMVIDIAEDLSVMYVHFLYLPPGEPAAAAREAAETIKDQFERRLLEVVR